jgi:hypothetical protein
VLRFDGGGIQDVVEMLVREQEHVHTQILLLQPVGDAVGRIHKHGASWKAKEMAVCGGDAAGVGGDFRHGDGERRERVGLFNTEKANSPSKCGREARYTSGR